jgi:hypothetical protein
MTCLSVGIAKASTGCTNVFSYNIFPSESQWTIHYLPREGIAIMANVSLSAVDRNNILLYFFSNLTYFLLLSNINPINIQLNL